MSTHNEFKGRGFKESKWPGLVIATQDPEPPKGIIEKIKENSKTSYENLIKNCGAENYDEENEPEGEIEEALKIPIE